MPSERVAPAAKAVITLLSTAVFFAAISVGTHSRFHGVSHFFLAVAMTIGFLALIKIFNYVLSAFFVARLVHWIHALSGEVLTFTFITAMKLMRICLFQNNSFLFSKNLTPLPPGTPILLVHGYCNDSSVWTYIQRRLVKESTSPVYTIDLGRPFGSLIEHAEKVKVRAEEIRRETGKNELILIGHSMGGVVSALVALEEPYFVSHLFTIGSPLGGTYLANIALGLNGKEMRRASKLLCELEQKLKAHTQTAIYHIGTKTDQIVIPWSSSLRGCCPDKEFLFEDIGHASLLFSPRVADLLVHWLQEREVIPAKHSEDLLCKEDSKSL